MTDLAILENFVRCFVEDGCSDWSEEDSGEKLVVAQVTDKSTLEAVYSRLPARFPSLYEQLVLTYRWHRAEVECDGVGQFRMLGNPPGTDLSGLLDEIFIDKALHPTCLENGYIQFGRGSGGNYDPLCFDVSSSKHRGRIRIVQLDHEEILCNSRIKIVATLADSFEELVQNVLLPLA